MSHPVERLKIQRARLLLNLLGARHSYRHMLTAETRGMVHRLIYSILIELEELNKNLAFLGITQNTKDSSNGTNE